MINVGVIGCGYWGPNLIRNFIACQETDLRWACDTDRKRLEIVMGPYPGVNKTTDYREMLKDKNLDGIAIATPVRTHFPIAKQCLENGKHVLLEKPLASSVAQGEELITLAKDYGLQVMCDHTFCYTGVVREIKEIISKGELGEILYFDSVRINLGLFQQDINVVWDLAPHDLSILDYLITKKPTSVSAHGVCHAGGDLENIAYVALAFDHGFIAHLHLNWLSPVKIRQTIIGGDKKMLVWNDMDPADKIKVYDKGITIKHDEVEARSNLLISYRSGNMYAPHIDHTEALALMVKEFAASIAENRPAITDGESGLTVLRILEAIDVSIKTDGANVSL